MDERERDRPLTPAEAVASRLREVRKARGWSAQQVAARCAALGMPQLDRSTVANIENGRRQRIGVDELLVLAFALGVAPVHLLVPLDERWYAVTPEHINASSRVRQWVRGNFAMTPLQNDSGLRQADRETYLSQQPEEEWTPPPEPTPEEVEERRRERIRQLLEAQEAGLVTIEQEKGGAWRISPTDKWVEEAGLVTMTIEQEEGGAGRISRPTGKWVEEAGLGEGGDDRG